MDTRILLFGLAATALTSCATVYKTGQTPDDVYYSPARPQEEYVQRDEDNDRRDNGDYYSLDDYRLRMQMRNRNRYSACNDDWYYDNWNTSNSWRYGWNNPWTWNNNINSGWYYSYNSWCYAPYPSYNTNLVNTKTFSYKPPIRNFGNSNTVPTTYTGKNGFATNTNVKPVRVYNNSNRNGGGFGNFLRQVFVPGSGNSGSSSGNSNRTYNPSSGSSGSSRSSGSSSGGSSSSRPVRNGKG
jgi:uncharacterized membrane protein YgcG